MDGARAALGDLEGDVEALRQVGATDVSDFRIVAVSVAAPSELGAALRRPT